MQEYFGQPKQSVFTCQMLEGTDGRKMSSSWGNIISIVDDPETMFGKVMSLHDDLIIKYFILSTEMPLEEIQTIEIEMRNGANPKDIKMRLASELVTLYHTEKDATLAKNSWVAAFQEGGIPETVPEIVTTKDKEMADVLVEAGVVVSKTDWRRLVEAGAIHDFEKGEIKDAKVLAYNGTFKIGKKRFVKIVVEEGK
jgi:tyrosyl-tRNA synthetase